MAAVRGAFAGRCSHHAVIQGNLWAKLEAGGTKEIPDERLWLWYTDGMYPKEVRLVDKEAIAWVRALGYCELIGHGECWGGLDVHHIRTRGSGGGDRVEDMALLCRGHHDKCGSHLISEEELREAMKRGRKLGLHSFGF